MDELRVLNLFVWGAMLLYMGRGAVASITKGARYGDPMRLACALTAFVFIAFNLYWLFGPSAHFAPGDPLMNGLLVLSAALGVYIWKLGMTYGRGALLARRDDDNAR